MGPWCLPEAREGLGYTVIRAPYSGIVVARHVRVGEAVAVGRPIMTGLSLEHLRVIAEIPAARRNLVGEVEQTRHARLAYDPAAVHLIPAEAA